MKFLSLFLILIAPLAVWSQQIQTVKVPMYCDTQESAELKFKNFFISENQEGLVFISEKKTIMPPMPVKISETTELRKTFSYLSQDQIDALSQEEKETYLALEKRMKTFDNFMDYITGLKCFEHSDQGPKRFSVASNLQWVSEKLIDSNLYPQGWKIDVYLADIDTVNTTIQKYILIGPCRVTTDNLKCLDILK